MVVSGTNMGTVHLQRSHRARRRTQYYRARYYDPSTGRFVSSDPIGLRGGINSYTYVGNSPLRWIDPSGLANAPTPPFTGTPGTWSDTPAQQRLYGPDGYPSVDIDLTHDHGEGSPHAHNWDRPAEGGAPSAANRGPGTPMCPVPQEPSPGSESLPDAPPILLAPLDVPWWAPWVVGFGGMAYSAPAY